jgi:hypothetical protein
MRLGIYAETQCPPEKSHYDLTWEIVRQLIHADEMGFDSYSVIERRRHRALEGHENAAPLCPARDACFA